MLAGIVAFFWDSVVTRLEHPVRWLDAIGLAFFAFAGAEQVLVFGLGPFMAALLAMVTGIGGGVARFLLRYIAIQHGRHLPSARASGGGA